MNRPNVTKQYRPNKFDLEAKARNAKFLARKQAEVDQLINDAQLRRAAERFEALKNK